MIKENRNNKLIEKRKEGWSFRRLAKHFNITVSRAYEIWNNNTIETEKEKFKKDESGEKERKEIIKQLLKKEYSFAKIGRIVGISRQRVHQISDSLQKN